MINWIIEQTLLISLCVLLFAFGRPFLQKLLGATGLYALWLAVPLLVLVSSISLPAVLTLPLQQYVVTAKQTTSSLTQHVDSFHYPLVVVWLGICGLLLLAVIRQHYRYMQSLKLTPIAHSDMAEQLRAEDLARFNDLKVFTSSEINSPFVSGVFRPALIIPSQFMHDYSPLQRQLILQHESVHHQRKDLIWNGLATMFTILFWFNPLSWYGLRLFRQSQEIACDQRVVATLSNSDRQAYANAMLSCAMHGEKMHLTVINYGAKDLMKERISTINTHKRQRFGPTASAIILILSTFLGINLAGANVDKVSKSGHEHPLTRIEPKYPVDAARQGIEGSVILQFDINTDGRVSNVKVVEANPKGVFGHNAKAALEQWTYHPLSSKQTGMLVQLDFKLDPNSEAESDLAMTESREIIAVVK